MATLPEIQAVHEPRWEERGAVCARRPLVVLETHPIQYHAPVYRELQGNLGVPVTAIYASDFSLAGYHDKEFGESFRWDTDLTTGYTSSFLATVAAGSSHLPEKRRRAA